MASRVAHTMRGAVCVERPRMSCPDCHKHSDDRRYQFESSRHWTHCPQHDPLLEKERAARQQAVKEAMKAMTV